MLKQVLRETAIKTLFKHLSTLHSSRKCFWMTWKIAAVFCNIFQDFLIQVAQFLRVSKHVVLMGVFIILKSLILSQSSRRYLNHGWLDTAGCASLPPLCSLEEDKIICHYGGANPPPQIRTIFPPQKQTQRNITAVSNRPCLNE